MFLDALLERIISLFLPIVLLILCLYTIVEFGGYEDVMYAFVHPI